MAQGQGIGEEGAGLLGPVAHGDHIIEMLTDQQRHPLRLVMRDVNADLPHDGNRGGIQDGRVCSRAGHVEPVAGEVAQQPLRHLAATGVSRAEKKDSRLHVGCGSNPCRQESGTGRAAGVSGTRLKEGFLWSRSHPGEVRVLAVLRARRRHLLRLPLNPALLFFLLLRLSGPLAITFSEGRFSWSWNNRLLLDVAYDATRCYASTGMGNDASVAPTRIRRWRWLGSGRMTTGYEVTAIYRPAGD